MDTRGEDGGRDEHDLDAHDGGGAERGGLLPHGRRGSVRLRDVLGGGGDFYDGWAAGAFALQLPQAEEIWQGVPLDGQCYYVGTG